MSWDRSWTFKSKTLNQSLVRQREDGIVAEYVGLTAEVEQEADDCITVFFTVPSQDDGGEAKVIEISIYGMGSRSHIISLEANASDNRMSEDADQLAEDLAAAFEAVSLEE